MKSNEKIMTAIKQRGDLCEPFLTVGKILKAGGMENWTGLCCDRIADAELIDMENVRVDFVNIGDMELTAKGVWRCREILGSYVSEDVLADAYELLRLEESARYHINEVARILREMGWRDLFNVLTKGDTREKVYAREEVRQRLCFGGIRESLRKRYYNIVARVKFRDLLAVCKRVRKEYEQEGA